MIGVALVGAVSTGALTWHWSRMPSTRPMAHAKSSDGPATSLSLLSPGILRVGLGSSGTSGAGLVLLEDGTMVVGATTRLGGAAPNYGGVVLRLTSRGRLSRPAVTLLADAPSRVAAVSAARDGTVAVSGVGSFHFLVARLLPDGVPDPAFGGGTVLANMRASMVMSGEAAHSVAIQPDGRIVAAGVASYALGPFAQGSYCATARFNRDGRLDRSFGDNGRVLTLVSGNTSCGAASVLVAPDGKIIVAGDYGSEQERRQIAVLRYLPDGTPDRRFGRDGAAELLQMSASANAYGAALDAQGRIVVVGTEWVSPTSSRLLVARFATDGNLDHSFGANGTVSLHEASVFQALEAVALQPDGKIVAVGHFGWHGGTRPPEPGKREQIAVVRLDTNGALDKSFAGGGLFLMSSRQYLWTGHEIAIQPDGKLLIVGNVQEEAEDRPLSPYAIIPAYPVDADTR